MKEKYDIADLDDIVRRLRGRDGCPWDSVQTHQSLVQYMIEEVYEAAEGVRLLEQTQDGENLCEELGDVLLHIVFQSQLAQEEGLFSLEDVISVVSRKMIHRHPRVFGENKEDISKSWDELKKDEQAGKKDNRHELEKVPKALPALMRAGKVQKKILKGGYGQDVSIEDTYSNILKSLNNLNNKENMEQNRDMARTEIGNILYQICRISGKYDVNPEEALVSRIDAEIMEILKGSL